MEKPTSTNQRVPQRALVTGASGFIGTRLVCWLHDRGCRIIAVDIIPPRVRLEGVDYRSWDVREPAPINLGNGIDVIYNLAAVHRTPGHPTHEYYETNVLGASNVTSLADSNDIKTIVFTSSISVYGPSEQLMTEASTPRPASAYGRSKQLAEVIHDIWLQRGYGRRLITVRPGVVFGPGERGNYTYLARALSRGVFFYPGRRTTVKSGGYIDDLLFAIDFALSNPERKVLFNFAFPTHSTTEDIIKTFAEVCGYKGKHATIPAAALYAAAGLFEVANSLGLRNPIHRDRIVKLMRSTRIEPGWLKSHGYQFSTDLKSALTAWRDETHGAFT